MIAFLRLLLLLVLAAPAYAQTAQKPLLPPMWEVRAATPAGESVVTIMGTVHSLPRGVDWFRPHLVEALDKADRLVLEIPPPDSVAGLMPTVIRLARNHEPRPLPSRVPESHRAALAAAVERLQPPPLEFYDSWYVALTLSNLQAAANGYDPRIGVEAVLVERARMRNIPFDALETAEEQLIYFDALSEADQQQLLMATVEDLDKAQERMDRMVKDWLAGNTEGLAAAINEDFQRSPMLMRMLVQDRNARWAVWIAERMKKPGRLFIAVGAGHLAGPGSLQQELARRGLQAERVEPPPPPPPARRRRR